MIPPKVSDCQKNCSQLQHSVMKFDRSNKLDLCYYGQVNSLRLKSSVASKWAIKHLWGTGGYHYFDADGTRISILMYIYIYI